MKIIDMAKRALLGTTAPAAVDVAKRDGVYVSRPLLPQNAKKWHDWAVKYGIPNPVPPEEMHVTIVHSAVDVKLPMDERAITIETRAAEWGDSGAFAMLGPDEESLTFCFESWPLHNRFHQFTRHGAVSTWPCYRPHLTLSNDAKGFELSDEALADVPNLIVLGPEVNAEPRKRDTLVANDDAEDDDVMVIVIEIAAAAAKAEIEKGVTLPLMDAYALHDVAEGRVSRGVAKRLAAIETMPDAIKALATAEKIATPGLVEIDGKKFIERELTMTVGPLPESISKKIGRTIDAFKGDDAERLAIGWASVSTVKGEFVEDLQGDTITTKAQQQWLHSIIKGQRAGKMEHEGDAVAEVVGGLLFDSALQKALGIDLGMEGLLVETHYTCQKTWDMVKNGDWMYSIAGRVLIEVPEDAA